MGGGQLINPTPTYPVTSVNGYTGAVTLTKTDIGLSNVQNVNQQNASNLTSGTVPVARLPIVSTTTNGIMSSADKTKLDGIETGAQVNNVELVKTVTVTTPSTGAPNVTNANFVKAEINYTVGSISNNFIVFFILNNSSTFTYDAGGLFSVEMEIGIKTLKVTQMSNVTSVVLKVFEINI